jgi:hypothetical protein
VIDVQELFEALRYTLPVIYHNALNTFAVLLAKLVRNEITAEEFQRGIDTDPALLGMFLDLAGKNVHLQNTLLSFGEGSQIGDVRVNDIAGGDMVKFAINSYPQAQSLPYKEAERRRMLGNLLYAQLVPVFQLVILSGPRVGEMIPLTSSRTVVGRSSDTDIPIEDPLLSRSHFAVNWDIIRKVFVLVDFGSANGVLINDEFVKEQRVLMDGDSITAGITKMVFKKIHSPPE